MEKWSKSKGLNNPNHGLRSIALFLTVCDFSLSPVFSPFPLTGFV